MEAEEIKRLIKRGKVYDLGQPYFPGMPHHPNHPPFAFSLTKKHGDVMYPNQVSTANDLFATGGHTGTHLDSLGHVSWKRKLFGGQEAEKLQSYTGGIKKLGIDATPPIIQRGILLDVAGALQKKILPAAFAIGPKELELTVKKEGVSFSKGDVVLIRTGWAQYWPNPAKFVANDTGAPGVSLAGAKWLAKFGMAFTGSDTTAYEQTPAHDLPVHVYLLNQKGIQILEMLNLEKIAEDKVYEFLFIALPLRILGGTASPVRPVAIC